MSREVVLGRLLLRVVQVVRQQRCNGHCLSDSVQHSSWNSNCAVHNLSRWTMARGHRLNTSIVLAAVHSLSGLFRAVSAVEPFTLSPPSHSDPVPNRPARFCGHKATLNQTVTGVRAATCAIACINVCAHIKITKAGSSTIVWKGKDTTHTGRNGWRCSYGFCSSKATQISRKG